jgi:hypothetical protein
MSFYKKFQNRLLMDLMSQHFDEANDLVRLVQKRAGKIDVSVISSYWIGQERMLKNKVALTEFIKFECEL